MYNILFFHTAFPGIKWGQVCEEDFDWWGVRVAGQGGPAEANGQLAQAAGHHSSDPILEKAVQSTVF